MYSDNNLLVVVVWCSRVSVVSRAQPADMNMSRSDRKLPLVKALACSCMIWRGVWNVMEEQMMNLKLL